MINKTKISGDESQYPHEATKVDGIVDEKIRKAFAKWLKEERHTDLDNPVEVSKCDPADCVCKADGFKDKDFVDTGDPAETKRLTAIWHEARLNAKDEKIEASYNCTGDVVFVRQRASAPCSFKPTKDSNPQQGTVIVVDEPKKAGGPLKDQKRKPKTPVKKKPFKKTRGSGA